MLKLVVSAWCVMMIIQPPLGGCVLKLSSRVIVIHNKAQPPLGGCVLKRPVAIAFSWLYAQPPLGGCVLKLQKSMMRHR